VQHGHASGDVENVEQRHAGRAERSQAEAIGPLDRDQRAQRAPLVSDLDGDALLGLERLPRQRER
jgi:hypothetical protein